MNVSLILTSREGDTTMKTRIIFCFLLTCLIAGQMNAQLTWVKSPDNPVLPYWSGDVNDPNGFKYAFEPSVMYDSGTGIYRMWFVSEPFTFGARFCVSSAISFDGTHWYADMKNPVFPATDESHFDPHIRKPSVLFDGTEYKMYYMGDSVNHSSIGLASSPDGKTWERYSGNPIIRAGVSGSWDESGTSFCSALHKDSTYYLWYSGGNASGISGIGLATSADGQHWTKHPGNPILHQSVSGWDQSAVVAPAVVHYNGTFYMAYLGASTTVCCQLSVGWASSPDGVNWNKDSSTPILTPSSGWENVSLGSSCLLVRNDTFHLYYSAQSNLTNHWETGLATAKAIPLGIGPSPVAIPKYATLSQSFPNPFNPATQIRFTLSKNTWVTLKIYDVLGKEITTLVNERKPAGNHAIEWNASGLPSGVYYYKIIADDFTETKEMILMK